ncbi:MAG: nucleotidyltransferase domain-containing protein, partial [Anaerolineae bacterium]
MAITSATSLTTYQAAREALLAQIIDVLRQDDRLVAAWLTGSYQRGDADAVSDLDLNVVVADAYATQLCARPRMVQTGTTEQRLALVSQFGTPA